MRKQNAWIEIFQWKEEEFKTRFEKDGYNWEEIKKKLENIERDEEIENRLNSLQWKTEDYYDYLKWLLEKQKIETKSEQISEEDSNKENNEDLQLKAEKAIIEKAKKSNNPIWKWIAEALEGFIPNKEDNFFEKFYKPILFWAGISFLWFFGFDVKKEIEELWKKWKEFANNLTGEIKNISEKKISENKKDENNFEKAKEISYKWYEKTWIFVLKTFMMEKNESQDFTDLFSKFSEKKYSDLQESFNLMVDSDWKMKEVEVEKFKAKNTWLKNYPTKDIFNVLNLFLSSKTTNIIFRDRLSTEKVKNIFEKVKQEKLEKILWKEVYENLKKNSYDLKNQSLKTIVTMLWLSYEWFIWANIIHWLQAGKDLFAEIFFSGENNFFENLKTDIEERKENLLPAKAIEILLSGSGINMWWAQKVDIQLSDLDLSSLNEIEKEKFSKFMDFKNEFLKEFRNPKSSFSLWLPDFRENFDKVINLREIIYLYFVCNWEKSFLKWWDILVKSGIYAWVYKLLEWDTKTSNFAWRYVAAITDSIRDDSEYFTKEEKLFLNILFYKITGVLLNPYLETAKQIEWWINQTIANWLIEKWFPKEYSNELAYLLEWAWWILSFFVLKRLRLLRFMIIPLTWWILYLLTQWYREWVLKDKISKEQFEQIKNVFNQFLGEVKPSVNMNWKTIEIDSIETYEKAQKNTEEVVKEQSTFDYAFIENWELKKVKEKPINWLFIEYNSTGYNIFYKWEKYKIKNTSKILEITDFAGIELQKKFINPEIKNSWIKFWIWANYFEIAYYDIEKAFKTDSDEKWNYLLFKRWNFEADVILEKVKM